MTPVGDLFNLARQYHQMGNCAQAALLYRQILQSHPTLAEVWAMLGAACQSQGRLNEAEASYRQALVIMPDHLKSANRLGIVLAQQGRHAEAMAHFQETMRWQPDNAELHHNLGVVYAQLKQDADAIACFRQALTLQPNYAEAHYNLGLALKSGQQKEAARAAFEQALQCRPHYPQAWNDLGNLLMEQDDLPAAASAFQQALAIRPDFAEAHSNLGIVLDRQGKSDDALAHFNAALKLDPHSAAIHNNIAASLNQRGRLEESIAHLRQSVQLNPEHAETQANLGTVLLEKGQLQEAVACFRQALRLKPNWATGFLNLAAALGRCDDLQGALECCREAVRLEPTLLTARSNLVSCLNLDPDQDADAVFAEHLAWGKLCLAAVKEVPHERLPEKTADGRLRIGYVSGDFRLHALLRYIEPVLTHHDPNRVETYCYAEVPFPDAGTARLRKRSQHWRSTCRLSDEAVVEQIRRDRIDILVDLAGHTANSRLSVFAHKPAPVQATWLGYMNTTGLPTIDYRLTDHVLDPQAQPIRDTEQLFRLPNGFCCFAPPEDAPPVRLLPARERGYVTFGSLNNLIKHNDRVFELWSGILRELPTARLLMFRHTLTGAAEERVRRAFAERGIGPERLELRRGQSTPGYLSVYDDIDVSLDTFPCTGGVTTCESLWMGVPVLTLAGVRPSGRNSTALLARVGLDDWAVVTPQQYLERAVQAASELDALSELRSQLRGRMQASLGDARRFTRELEDAYFTMWRNRSR